MAVFNRYRLEEALKFVENLWELNKRSCIQDDILFCLKLCGGIWELDKEFQEQFFKTYTANKTFKKETTKETYVGFVATICRVVTADRSKYLQNEEVEWLCCWLLRTFSQLDSRNIRLLSASDVVGGLSKIFANQSLITKEEARYLFSTFDHESREYINFQGWIIFVHAWLVKGKTRETLPPDHSSIPKIESVSVPREVQICRHLNRSYDGTILKFRQAVDEGTLKTEILTTSSEDPPMKKGDVIENIEGSFGLGGIDNIVPNTDNKIPTRKTRSRSLEELKKLEKLDPDEFRRSIDALLGNSPDASMNNFVPDECVEARYRIQKIISGHAKTSGSL